ncbi:MAG: amidohydrolase family protein [Gemmatimonadaceae bacterium]|nr:amidohydrolase family protein [Gemmatimonadaceae bacterium]
MPASRLPHAAVRLVVLALVAACRTAPEAAPDRIVYNGRIWTGDSTRAEASALALRGDRILAVGSDSAIRALATPATRQEDLRGRRVVPGFHDAHWHLPTRRSADLTGAKDPAELVARLQAFAATLPAGTWVLGRGWTPDMFPRNAAHRRYLDAAFPDRAVLLTDRDGHQTLANQVALSRAGVSASTQDPAGGAVGRDPGGAPSGLLQETASALVRTHLPEPTTDEVYAALRYEMHRAAALGLTSLQLANGLDPAEHAAFVRALADDSLLVRFRVAVPFEPGVSDSVLREYRALSTTWSGPLLRAGIAKGMLDGTVDAGTAAMLAPYARGGGQGLPRWTPAELASAVARYDSAGLQVELHAIGDRAIRMALDAFEQRGSRTARHRVEHIEVPDPADIARFAPLGVIASTQAIFAGPDKTALQNYVPMLGAERSARAMPFKAFDDAGAIQAFGSDYPVFPMDPLLGMFIAVTRQMPDGTPEGGWFPQHRLTLEAALRHYTWGSAYAAFRERELGVLTEGMLADFVVLSEEIVGADPRALLRAKPVLTVMGGRDTYRAAPDPGATTAAATTTATSASTAAATWCAALPRAANAAFEVVDTGSDWFTVYRVEPGLFALVESRQFQEAISYLLVGTRRALLFDTGIGLVPMAPVIATLTSLPVTVLNSHTHFDHVGANAEFRDILGMDTPFTRESARGRPHTDLADEVAAGSFCGAPPSGADTAAFRARPFTVTGRVADGDSIDLGGRTVVVLAAPGHTPDAIALHEPARGLLFTGDSYYDSTLWLFSPGTDLAAYERSMARLAALVPGLRRLLPAHNTVTAEPTRLLAVLDGVRTMRTGGGTRTAEGGGRVSVRVGDVTFMIRGE